MSSALAGLRVLDFTSYVSGPFCTMMLADMGADVVKVEKATGDDSRRMPPFVNGESGVFMQLNRNKRSIVLDLKNRGDLAACAKLAERADVIVENFKPGAMDRLGLGYGKLSAADPRQVYCSISGFGQQGPYSNRGGLDLMTQAMSGLMSVNGPADGPPFRLPIAISDIGAGMYAAFGILAALAARERTGKGQHVDASLYDTAVSFGIYEAARYFSTGQDSERIGQAHRGAAPYEVFQTKNGWITVGAATQSLWDKLCDVLKAGELAKDRRFSDNARRVANHDILVELLAPYFRNESTEHWERALLQAGVPAGPVRKHSEVYTNAHTVAREMVVPVDHPTVGEYKVLGVPVRLSRTPGRVMKPAPTLGQHSKEILAELEAK